MSGRISTQKPDIGGAQCAAYVFRKLRSVFFARKVSANCSPLIVAVLRVSVKILTRSEKAETENADKEKLAPLLLPHLSPHTLRHSFTSRAVESNAIPPKHLQTMLGHSSIQVTMDIYAEISDEALQNFMSAFDEI